MPVLDVRVLGPFVVLRAGAIVPTGRSKQRDLLALLAAHAPRSVSADNIIDELWQGAPPPTARKVMHKHVSELRHLLGREHLLSLAGGYALSGVAVDSDLFAAAIDATRLDEPHLARERLSDALMMWRGDPYADVDLDALAPIKARLIELRLAVVEQLNEARLALGEHAALIADLERLVIEHPVREAMWGQLMRALYAAGRQGDALRAFQRLRAVLARELGIEPSGELRQLEQSILDQEHASAQSPEPVEAFDVDDVHRRVMTIAAVDLVEPNDDDPEDRARAMKAAHDQLRMACEMAGGTLESSMGARVLIAFGAPAHEDDADRAVHLANHIVARFPAARVSLATGWALVQLNAEPGAHVVGSVIEVACSALASTPPGTVHVDQSTSSARSRPIADPPFVGRERELTIAGHLIARTLSGHGPQAITVRGEAGVGKTRFVRELRRRVPIEATWLHVRCAEGASPSAPLEAVVREHIVLPADATTESATPAVLREGFDALLQSLIDGTDEREWLRRRIGPAERIADAESFGGMVERSEIVAAWTTYLTATAQHGPTVIVLDDVHRADPAFDGLLTDCCAHLRDVPLLVLSTARPDRPDRAFQWVGTDNLNLTLRGLDAAETDELLGHLLNDDPVTDAQHALVRTRSAGNPLYAIHFARMLRQQGWGGAIPDSTRALIAARLDLLAPLERALIFAATVADQPFGVEQVAAMQGVDEGAAGAAVRHLVEKALLVTSGRDECSFSHDLVREVASEHLVRGRRARLHQAAAVWLEQHAGDRVADEAMRIANHLAAAASALEEDGEDAKDLRDRAFRLMIVAGDRLRGLGIEDIASRLADEALAEHAPGDIAELQRQRAVALSRAGRLSEATAAARAGLDASRQVDDRSLQARLTAMVGEIHWLRGETAACIEALEEVMILVDDLPDDRAATEAIAGLAFFTALLGRPSEAIPLAERGLALARQHSMPDKEVRCLNARGAALLLQGSLEGYNDFMRALTRALEEGLSHESAMAYHNLAELQLQGLGPVSSAELNQRGLELAERRGLTLAADWLRSNRVQVYFEGGRWDDALSVAGAVLAGEARAGQGQAGTACAIGAARIHLWRGDLPRARALMADFLPRARQHAVIQQLGPALIVAGLIETASGRIDRGLAFADEYCDVTSGAEAYRHMEVADLVRLLVRAGRVEQAAEMADNEVIPAIRNQCHTATAHAVLARARADSAAVDLFHISAGLWNAYGHPLEEYLALSSANALRRDRTVGERCVALATTLSVAPASIEALCPG